MADIPEDSWFSSDFAKTGFAGADVERASSLQCQVPWESEHFEYILLISQRSCESLGLDCVQAGPKV